MKSLEQLSPDTILANVQSRAEELLKIIDEKKRVLARAPRGRIKLIRRGGNIHSYHVTDSAKPAGKYIPVTEHKLIKALAQKDYDQTVLKKLQKQLWVIDEFIRKYDSMAVQNIWNSLGDVRKTLIQPITLPDVDYVANWLAQTYEGKPFVDESSEYLTSKGERVRSKSEMIIADILAYRGVPYKYECPRHFEKGSRGVTFHPDFTCLNVRTREEFLWEHLGRMDDPDYASNAVGKMRIYCKNGFILGRNLIVTMECGNVPLDRKEVESAIKAFLL